MADRRWGRAVAGLVAAVSCVWSAAAAADTVTVALEGEPAPDLPTGVLYGEPRTPAVNGAGRVAFTSPLTGTGVTADNDTGLWAGAPGNLKLIAREGDPAPGTAADWGDFTTVSPLLDGAGQVVFHGNLTGAGITTGNDRGLWVGSQGNLVLLAREGNPPPGFPADEVFDLLSDPVVNVGGDVAFRGRW